MKLPLPSHANSQDTRQMRSFFPSFREVNLTPCLLAHSNAAERAGLLTSTLSPTAISGQGYLVALPALGIG